MQHHLYHHGILGQKWGVRRFENKDGTLTPAGKKRYRYDRKDNSGKQKNGLSSNTKKALVIGAAAVGTALAACGAYKLAKSGKLNGLIQIGRSAVQNMNMNGINGGDRTIRGKLSPMDKAKFFGNDYKRRNNAMDVHIRNHARL